MIKSKFWGGGGGVFTGQGNNAFRSCVGQITLM